jgi:hypothetical protein
MGRAYVAEDAVAGNVPSPSPSNVGDMEGLTNGPSTDRYGGGDDDDDSGSISYLSIRYGGKVVNLNNELNGLSLGGIGRGTDIDHVEIMNNVDDGIEIWGGTLNVKYFSIWNVGDDSFDVDQGWRGKAQFGLIVQGHSLDAAQGSGVGDNCFETDGAEDSDWQPVTTATIYNCTVIGQPISGDHGTAWRDNARVQYRNCLFMDLGEQLVKFDNVDGDGGHGYGFNGTLSWADTWTTDYDAVPAHANDPANPGLFYTVQVDGKLAEVKDSVFFRNQNGSAYTEATARGVFAAGNDNVLIAGIDEADSPIMCLSRGPIVAKGDGRFMQPVLGLDPRPRFAAATSVGTAPNDGFFTPASYRGAFAPYQAGVDHWLVDWTASYAYGFTPGETIVTSYCTAGTTTGGCHATMSAAGTASLSNASPFTLTASGVDGNKNGILFYSIAGRNAAPWGNGQTLLCVKSPTQRMNPPASSGGTNGQCDGSYSRDWNAYVASNPNKAINQALMGGTVIGAQSWFRDGGTTGPVGAKGTALSDAIEFCVVP